MKALKIGIMPRDKFQQRTLDIAAGRYKPKSIKELANMANRKPGNLSRTLHNMARYGIVEIEKHGRAAKPIAKAVNFNIEYGISA